MQNFLDADVKRLATEGRNFGVLTTMRPASYVMWVDADDEHVLVTTQVHRVKYADVQRDPRVTVVVMDAADPYRYVEVRGRVVGELRGPEVQERVDALARRYLGVERYEGAVQSERVFLRIAPERVRKYKVP